MMRKNTRDVPRWIVFVALVTWASAAALAQAPGQAPDQMPPDAERHGIFLDTVDVHVVNVEVVALDSSGEPVTGLTAEDFELSEDGEPREILNFAAFEGRVRRTGPAPAAEEEDPELAATLPENTTFLTLLVDNAHIGPTHRKAVFEQLRDQLDRLLGPSDRVMVVAMDQTLAVEQTFTDDRTLVETALASLEKTPGGGAFNLAQRDRILGEIQRGAAPGGAALGAGGGGGLSDSDPEADARDTLAMVQVYANSARERGRRSMALLQAFVDSLAGLPGRKAVLYVSDGIELSPGELLFRVWDDKYGVLGSNIGVPSIEGEIAGYDATDELRKVIAAANSNRVAFYTVDAAGNRAFSGISAAGAGGFAVAGLVQRESANQQESLRFLAQSTGGVALLNNLNLENLFDQMEKDFSTYYSLGFVSPYHGDGEYHKIKIRAKRDGVTLRYLEGYKDKTAQDRMVDRTLAALLLDVADNPLEVRVELGEAKREKDHYVVAVQVKIPLAKLVLLPQEEAHLGQVSLFVMAQDEKGRMSAPQRIPVPIRIPNEQMLAAMTQVAGYTTHLAMRPGGQKLAVGVIDELGSVQSTLNLNVDVGGGG